MGNDELHELASEKRFVLALDELKNVARRNPLSRGFRRERVAEHSWHVALAVLLLGDASPDDEIDMLRALKMALIHDLAELYVGDTFAFGDDTDSQHEREHAAMDVLRDSVSSSTLKDLVELWYEYEAQDSPEARFVKAMDVYLPIVLNHANIDSSSWKFHGVEAKKVEERVERVRSTLGVLAADCDARIDDAKARGYLR